MSGRTQRQRKLTEVGIQYKSQLARDAERAKQKESLKEGIKALSGLKVDDRAAVTLDVPKGPAPPRPLPGAPVIRPPTFQYPPPPKDEVDDLAARFGKLGGRTRRRHRKGKKHTRK